MHDKAPRMNGSRHFTQLRCRGVVGSLLLAIEAESSGEGLMLDGLSNVQA